MSVGLVALLDDVAAIAKLAAASLDDIAGQAAKSGAKAAGVVIDDAAVTPRYVVGFSPARELPIVWKIARGSLRNKLLILLPAALLLSLVAPFLITPLLMLGGAYLCYEGAEKLYGALFPHQAHAHEAALGVAGVDPATLEAQKVAGAVRTDFILSAEIMAITLASIPPGSLWRQALVLAFVGIGITVLVYGGVALIVKADDAGLSMARNGNGSAFGSVTRALGRLLVRAMPVFLAVLAMVGTAAMIWVGGGIIVHGLEEYGIAGPAHLIHDVAAAAGRAAPWAGALGEWFVNALGSGLVGLVLGALLIPLVSYGLAPAWALIRRR